jgi:UPF0042 nucleotide-binding protein
MTADVKEELARVEVGKTAVRAAELAALLRFSGGLHIIGGRIAVEAELDSPQIARRLRKDLAELYGVRSEVSVISGSSIRATSTYLVRVIEGGETLARQTGLLDGITAERARMSELRELSDFVIDTTDLNIHQLATRVQEMFADEAEVATRVTVLSFGFKYGLPPDADLVADCRFLPNPFWIPELSGHTGLEDEVRDYVLGQEGAEEFIDAYAKALEPVLAGYRRENKRHATIALGCTGGKHRSVAIAEELGRRLGALPGLNVKVKHRDLGRE